MQLTVRGQLAIVETDDPQIYQNEDDEGFPIGEPQIIFRYRVFIEDAELVGLTAEEREFINDSLIKEVTTICQSR